MKDGIALLIAKSSKDRLSGGKDKKEDKGRSDEEQLAADLRDALGPDGSDDDVLDAFKALYQHCAAQHEDDEEGEGDKGLDLNDGSYS